MPGSQDHQELSFVVLGDPQRHNDQLKRLVDQIVTEEAAFLVILGDLVDDADDTSSWRRFAELAAPLFSRFHVYAVPGNHDYQKDGSSSHFLSITKLARTYHSATIENCCFLWLDTVLDAPTHSKEQGSLRTDSAQYTWLKETLKSARRDHRNIFVFAHHPILMPTNTYFTTSPDIRLDALTEPPTLGNLFPLLEEYGVSAYFAGHIHAYEHSEFHGITFVTSGATSYELWPIETSDNSFRVVSRERYHYLKVTISASRMSVAAIDEKGTVLDSFAKSLAVDTGRNPLPCHLA